MKLEAVEKDKEKLKVAVHGETHTLLNLLREKSWVSKADQASYVLEHPYLSVPNIIIRAKNPKKVLTDAAQLVIDDVKEFRKEFKRSVK